MTKNTQIQKKGNLVFNVLIWPKNVYAKKTVLGFNFQTLKVQLRSKSVLIKWFLWKTSAAGFLTHDFLINSKQEEFFEFYFTTLVLYLNNIAWNG
jgi:hypothetical protein